MKRMISAAGAAVILSISLGLPALAAPKTMEDGSLFDAAYYAAHNPDVVQALGTDERTLYDHYERYGKAEGRLPYDPAEAVTDGMAAAGTSAGTVYVLQNPDTQEVRTTQSAAESDALEAAGWIYQGVSEEVQESAPSVTLEPQARYLRAGERETGTPVGMTYAGQTYLTMTEHDAAPSGVVEIWRADTRHGQYVLVGQINDSYAMSYSDTNLAPGREYYYRIRRISGDGSVSGFSGVEEYLTAFPAVSDAVIRNGKLTWSAVKGADGYIVLQQTGINAGGKLAVRGTDEKAVTAVPVTETSMKVPRTLRRVTNTYEVLPYRVRNGYYYVHGIPPCKSAAEAATLLTYAAKSTLN